MSIPVWTLTFMGGPVWLWRGVQFVLKLFRGGPVKKNTLYKNYTDHNSHLITVLGSLPITIKYHSMSPNSHFFFCIGKDEDVIDAPPYVLVKSF